MNKGLHRPPRLSLTQRTGTGVNLTRLICPDVHGQHQQFMEESCGSVEEVLPPAAGLWGRDGDGQAALCLPAASFKLALWDSTFTKLIVRSELVEAAGERLIKQNELLTACTDTRSINAHDMYTQCESVLMEASRTAASRLINVWRKRLPQRRHQQQFKTSISASSSVKGK